MTATKARLAAPSNTDNLQQLLIADANNEADHDLRLSAVIQKRAQSINPSSSQPALPVAVPALEVAGCSAK